jgi:hypothetical protein
VTVSGIDSLRARIGKPADVFPGLLTEMVECGIGKPTLTTGRLPADPKARDRS